MVYHKCDIHGLELSNIKNSEPNQHVIYISGTGACAIYPLLAAVKNKWNMVGTETDSDSFVKAEENIQKNGLQELIKCLILLQNN